MSDLTLTLTLNFNYSNICFSYLVVFAQIGPHAGAVSSAHQNVVTEKINPRDRTSELAAGRVIVVSQVGYYVVELQHLVALVLLFQSYIKGDLWHGAVSGRTYRTGCAGTRRSR